MRMVDHHPSTNKTPCGFRHRRAFVRFRSLGLLSGADIDFEVRQQKQYAIERYEHLYVQSNQRRQLTANSLTLKSKRETVFIQHNMLRRYPSRAISNAASTVSISSGRRVSTACFSSSVQP